MKLAIGRGKQVVYRNLWYKGEVRVQIVGEWSSGQTAPLWVMTDLGPEQGLADLKSLLGIERVMNKRQEQMGKVLALVLLTYAVALLVERLYWAISAEMRVAAIK